MEFFEVTAKCGHVGKGQYFMGVFYVRAESGSEAAAIVRLKSRVKHDHKDAILNVIKIGYVDFKLGQANYRSNPYYHCKNVQEQRLCIDVIENNIMPESRYDVVRRNQDDRRAKLMAIHKQIRKMNKYCGNNYYDIGA